VWRFYRGLLWKAPRLLLDDAVGRIASLFRLAFLALLAVRPTWADVLGVPSAWWLAPIGALFLFVLARAIYDHHEEHVASAVAAAQVAARQRGHEEGRRQASREAPTTPPVTIAHIENAYFAGDPRSFGLSWLPLETAESRGISAVPEPRPTVEQHTEEADDPDEEWPG
jgi:uncharacterized membrane protein